MHLIWRIGLGIACAALAIGLFAAWKPVNESQATAPPPPPPPTTTDAEPTSTAPTNSGPLEAAIEVTKDGVAAPVSLSVGAGEKITLTITSPYLAHLALVGDDEAGGFVEPGQSRIEFTVATPGTYQMQLHTDAPEPFELGDLIVVPAS